MKKILLLGGTTEGLGIAKCLSLPHIYSLAGVGGELPALKCQLRVGGFGGIAGLIDFIRRESISLLVDATHPYAAQMSCHAAEAAQQQGIPYWALHRVPWTPNPDDQWIMLENQWPTILDALSAYKRPLFTIGRQPLIHFDSVGCHQHWFVRSLQSSPLRDNVTMLSAKGPFTYISESVLFEQYGFDVLISKNSGGTATEPKLKVAREKKIPVIMLHRPPLPTASRQFHSQDGLLNALLTEIAV